MRIVQRAGYFMGTNLNETEDALDFFELAERWSARQHAAWCAGDTLNAPWRLRRELDRAIRRHRRGLRDNSGAWGWKQPRSMHFLPVLQQRFPELRFVHVIRDGRDLAIGRETANRIAAGLAGSGVYSAVAALGAASEPPSVQLMLLWAQANTLANEFGETTMGSRYQLVRLEDLCATPHESVRALLKFAGVNHAADTFLASIAGLIERPASIGLHNAADRQELARITAVGADALARFGYE